jgi:hypothetical protein
LLNEKSEKDPVLDEVKGSLPKVGTRQEPFTKSSHCASLRTNSDKPKSRFKDIYQQCVSYFSVLATHDTSLNTYKDKNCNKSTDAKTEPVIEAGCNSFCKFDNIKCGLMDLSYRGKIYKIACRTKEDAQEAATQWCSSRTNCTTSNLREKIGSEIAKPVSRKSGGTVVSNKIQISSATGVKSDFEFGAGIIAEGGAALNFTTLGEIKLTATNGGRLAVNNGYVTAGTSVECRLSITEFVSDSIRGAIGVGGDFKIFGIGGSDKTVVEAKDDTQRSHTIETFRVTKQGAGIPIRLHIENCIDQSRADINGKIKAKYGKFADALTKEAGELRKAAATKRENAIVIGKMYTLRNNEKECYCHFYNYNKPGSGQPMGYAMIQIRKTDATMNVSKDKVGPDIYQGWEYISRKTILKYDGIHDDTITTKTVCKLMNDLYAPKSSKIKECWYSP